VRIILRRPKLSTPSSLLQQVARNLWDGGPIRRAVSGTVSGLAFSKITKPGLFALRSKHVGRNSLSVLRRIGSLIHAAQYGSTLLRPTRAAGPPIADAEPRTEPEKKE
jgi:hypothetical protein